MNEVSYVFEIEHCDTVVIARMCAVTDTSNTEISRGHGHIIHEGVNGIAQAASYAVKRLYDKMGGNNFKK